jgi:2-dehydro-3-deoxygalactonokinase
VKAVDTAAVSARIAPGLSGTNFAGAPDVMRGEETQIFGALALAPELASGDATLVLPGTHSKWAAIHDGQVRRFQTVMTGELFGLLRDHSALAALPFEGEAGDGFDDGLAAAEDGAPLAQLFAARSRQLVEGKGRAWALEYLSGLLIGGEIAAMTRATGANAITIVGAAALEPRYSRAAERFGVSARSLDGEACAIAGLLALAGDQP